MKRKVYSLSVILIALAAAVAVPVRGQRQTVVALRSSALSQISSARTVLLQNAAAANGNGAVMETAGLAVVGTQVTGGGTGTLNWEVTIDRSHWVPVMATRVDTQIQATTAAAGTSAAYIVPVSGMSQFRARISGYGGGNITVTGIGTPSGTAFTIPSIGGGGIASNVTISNPIGQASMAGSVAVTIASDQSAIPVSGTVTATGFPANTDLTLLASAARTTTTNSADQTNTGGRGLILTVNVTVVGTGSVTPIIQAKDPVSGSYFTIWSATSPLVTNGLRVYMLYPGASGGSYTEISPQVISRVWRLELVSNNANAVTASVGATEVL